MTTAKALKILNKNNERQYTSAEAEAIVKKLTELARVEAGIREN